MTTKTIIVCVGGFLGAGKTTALATAAASEIRASAKAHTQESRDEVRYQYGAGCLSDQILGQWFAHVIGFGHLLEPERPIGCHQPNRVSGTDY
jgi:hypothetical protein